MKKLHATVLKNGPLTDKEMAVLCYLCEGCTRTEIALLKLHRSISTINRHVEHIAEKLESTSTAEIVSTAVAAGLVRITVDYSTSLAEKFVVVLLMLNVTSGHLDARRGPQSPRPARTMRAGTRLNRTGRQYP